jgi:hypothetical protein
MAAMVCASGAGTAGADDGMQGIERGRYLVAIMDCTGCHTDGALLGRPDADRYLAGSEVGLGGPQGVVYPPNLTPDPETGLGRWSDEEIIAAFTSGHRPDGRLLSPAMPWPSYAHLTGEDALAVVAYLRSLPAVDHRAPSAVPAGGKPVFPYLAVRPVD